MGQEYGEHAHKRCWYLQYVDGRVERVKLNLVLLLCSTTSSCGPPFFTRRVNPRLRAPLFSRLHRRYRTRKWLAFDSLAYKKAFCLFV